MKIFGNGVIVIDCIDDVFYLNMAKKKNMTSEIRPECDAEFRKIQWKLSKCSVLRFHQTD